MLRLASPVPGEATRPVLPPGCTRSDVERLLPVIRRAFRLSEACAFTLLAFMQATRPSDWTDPARDPVCHAMQTTMALRLGLTPRAVRYHEATLERAGFEVVANGPAEFARFIAAETDRWGGLITRLGIKAEA